MQPMLGGIHHITAIASDPQRNLDFYTGFLGLRLVKKTVNFDDPGTYHFYFGDREGQPGSILTFFPWPGARRGRQGSGQVTAVSFAIPPGSVEKWVDKTKQASLLTDVVVERFGEKVLRLYDPDGLPIELIERADATESLSYFAPPTIELTSEEASVKLLTAHMGFREAAREGRRVRYQVGEDGPATTIDIETDESIPRGLQGAGTVHHIAWRTPDDSQQLRWQGELMRSGHATTQVMDRVYFHSIYFREPGGVLYEIATDQPGFAFDEPVNSLGSALKLPPWLESQRDRIEARLPQVSPADVMTRS